jgi:hypothetical protein
VNKGMPTAAGELAILNVGDGDTKLSFDPKNPAECIRAARIVRDMLRRGYALMIQVDGAYQRVTEFRDDVFEYVIADFDPLIAAEKDAKDTQHEQSPATPPGEGTAAPATKRGPYKKRGVAASSTRAVAVAPISGG